MTKNKGHKRMISQDEQNVDNNVFANLITSESPGSSISQAQHDIVSSVQSGSPNTVTSLPAQPQVLKKKHALQEFNVQTTILIHMYR